MPTPAENQAIQRQGKLDDMDSQIKNGSLVVRQMTEVERQLNPPRTDTPLRKRGQRK